MGLRSLADLVCEPATQADAAGVHVAVARPPCCPRSFKGGKSPAVEESGRLLHGPRGLGRSSVASIDVLLLLLKPRVQQRFC